MFVQIYKSTNYLHVRFLIVSLTQYISIKSTIKYCNTHFKWIKLHYWVHEFCLVCDGTTIT